MTSVQLPDGRWEHCFRQSDLSSFQRCPEAMRAVYMGEIERLGHTDSTALGVATHFGIQYALTEKRDAALPPLSETIDVARNCLDDIGEWRYTKMSRASVYDRLVVMLSAWAEDFEPLIEPNLVEEPFKRLPLHEDMHRSIMLSGTPDCVDIFNVVIDFKTSSQLYEPWEHDRWSVQASTYCWAQRAIPGVFRYNVMLHDGTTQTFDIGRDERHVVWLKRQCLQIATMIESGIKPWPLIDSSWLCSARWCDVFASGRCKGEAFGPKWKA
jgi:hypothetical protein